jgi:hypothetical protein
MDPKGRMAGHTMRWIRLKMVDRVGTNQSTTKPDADETRQGLVTVVIDGTAAEVGGGCNHWGALFFELSNLRTTLHTTF